MFLTDIKDIDNDYAIIHSKLMWLQSWSYKDARRYENHLYMDRIEILAENGQKEAIMMWYMLQDNKKLHGEQYKENKKIDEQYEKMDKSSIQFKMIAIDKLRFETKTFKCINNLQDYQKRYDEIQNKLDYLEAEGLDKRKDLNEQIANLKMQQDKIRQQANLEWAKILETPFYKAIRNLIVNEFNELMNSVSVLDASFLYRNVKIYVREYNRALKKVGQQELYIKNDNIKVIAKKLKALYKQNPDVPYVALRYANLLRNEKSLLLKLSGYKMMKKISKTKISESTKDLMVNKTFEDVDFLLEN